MNEMMLKLIEELAKKHSDPRISVFQIEVKSDEVNQLSLSGIVLEQADLDALQNAIEQQFSDQRVDTSGIQVLRHPDNPILTVGTNLTSTHTSPSFLGELSSQLVYGEKVEVLSGHERWVYTRQADGYLSHTYKPYLTAQPDQLPTHIVLAPSIEIRAQPDISAPVLTRLYCGTRLKIITTETGWSQVNANMNGWMPESALRALDSLPRASAVRRSQMIEDARRMIGTPYLWGGAAGNGIDCSGFARLLHRWIGMDIPRDADMQSAASRPVEPPFLPGDLCFFGDGDSNRRITHVGISLGGWNMIHSSRSRNGVYTDNIKEVDHLRESFAHAGTFLKSE